ncbi:MAG: transglutaminase-like domain-containing protein, partial [Pseudomonadota bacterium]|nr:transglutaminase-like domain-containing protein [Pseudomonadota bacterium]
MTKGNGSMGATHCNRLLDRAITSSRWRAVLLALVCAGSALVVAASTTPRDAEQAARDAMMRGEDPGAFVAQLTSQRALAKTDHDLLSSKAPASAPSGLRSLNEALIRSTNKALTIGQRSALMRRALGEVVLMRSELEADGVRAKSIGVASALTRWQAADSAQGVKLRAIESALKAALVESGDKAATASLDALRVALRDSQPEHITRILGTRALPVSPPDFAPRPLPVTIATAPSFASSTAIPGGSADLTATADTAISPAIAEKALSLQYEPVRIHDFVRSQIRTEWYAGAQKGANETLRSGAGNDADQASLLIALLRASSMPARYVKGIVELKLTQLGPMLGVTSAADIGRALTAAGIAHEPVIHGAAVDAFRIEHLFVSAYLPYGNYRGSHVDAGGKAWIPLAPAIKEYTFTASGDVLARAGIGANNFISEWLAAAQTSLPLDGLRQRAQAWLATQAGQPLLDTQLQRHVVATRPLGVLPANLPAKLIDTVYEATGLADADQQWLRVRLRATSDANSAVALEQKFRVSELLGRRLTLSYQPASEDDQNIINGFGSFPLTPAYLVRVRARLLLRGEPNAHSVLDWTPGTAHRLELISETPAGEVVTSQQLIAGSYTALTLGAQAGATPVSLLDVPHPNDSEFVAAQRLASLGLRYANSWDQAENELANLVGVLPIRPAPSIGLTLVEYQVQTLLNLPSRLILKGVSFDAAQRPTQPIATSALRNREAEFLRYTSLHGSALEHWIFENDWGVPSISADKGLQLAAQNGIARVTQTGGTLPAAVALSANIRDEINQQLARGWRVDVAASEVTLNLWSGAVWHAEDPATGASGWFIA